MFSLKKLRAVLKCLLREQTVSHKRRQNTDYLHLNKQRLCKCYKVYEDYVKFDTEQAENTKSAER